MAKKVRQNQEVDKSKEPWTPIDQAGFIDLIRMGIEEFLPNLETAIRRYLTIELDDQLSFTKNGISKETRDAFLDKVAVYLLLPGTKGLESTRETIEELLRLLDIESLHDIDNFKESNIKFQNQDEILYCQYCKFPLEKDDYQALLIEKEPGLNNPTHYHCVVTYELRETYLDLREVSVEIRRQIQYSKKIITAFLENPNRVKNSNDIYPNNPLEGVLENRQSFINWLFHIYVTWSDFSDIPKSRHIIYWSHFLTLSNFLIEFNTDQKSISYYVKFLIKYLDKNMAQNILENYFELIGLKVSKSNISKEIRTASEDFEQKTTHKTFIIKARKYTLRERELISSHFSNGHTVIIDSTRLTDGDATLMMDYVSGLMIAQNGFVHQISENLVVLVLDTNQVIRER